MFALLFLFVGCGGGSNNDYDTYDDEGSSQKNDSDADKQKDDSDKNDNNKIDADPSETENKDDADSADTENDDDVSDTENGSNTDDADDSGDFWSTCEGIIACSTRCIEGDSECVSDCYGNGSTNGQLNYRRWRECFDEKCAEDKTAECSAANCAESDEKCNVAEAFEYEFVIPAPYGEAEFAGDFSYILGGIYPSTAEQIVKDSFAKGNIGGSPITSGSFTASFVKTGKNAKDGSVVDVCQTSNVDTNSMTPGNPFVILRIKQDSAVAGKHSVGVADESEARFIVVDIDSKYNILCYHAFGIGEFTIDEVDLKTGASGRLKFSGGAVELFYPENIPELGGDAREILGVTACSLIDD